MDKKFILTAFGYAGLGMLLGIVMAATKDNGQLVTHAHILLAGFVVSFVYAVCHKLWIKDSASKLANLQFYVHQAGVALMVTGLFLLYGKFIALEVLDPILALSSMFILVGAILMKVLLIRAFKKVEA